MSKSASYLVFLLFVGCSLTAQTVSPTAAAAKSVSQPPNILFLFADDLGYGELGCYGQKVIQTPVLDSLAKSGMRFIQFYAGNAVCAPSRAVLMTGKHPGHAEVRGNSAYYGAYQWGRIALAKTTPTIAELLRDRGYATAMIGKWHLDRADDPDTWATARGFDFASQVQWASRFDGRQWNEAVHYFNQFEDSLTYDPKAWDCIDQFRTEIAIDYLKNRKGERPFFLYMSYRIPHTREQYIRDTSLYANQDWPPGERVHAARISLLDREIGRLLAHLRANGELANTLVIFTSDNGPHGEGGHDPTFFESSGGLRGIKRDLYEGGIRVPFIAAWPEKIPAGTVSEHLGAAQDFWPTLAEIAGTPADGSDGRSLVPTLKGTGMQATHPYLYWEIQLDGWFRKLPQGGFRQALRQGTWKAVRYGLNQPTELYDLERDPKEQSDLAEQFPDRIQTMEELMKRARTPHPYFPYGGVVQDYRARERFGE